MDTGWVKLYRVLLDKPIWLKSTPEQKSILITVLLMANHNQGEWEWKGEKFKVEKGQFVTSLESIRKRAGYGISIQNVRAALRRFESAQFLTNKSTKSGRLISIINWDSYQPLQEQGQQSSQQRPNKDPTPNKNVRKKEKNYSVQFLEFYSAYPLKKSKAKAFESWKKLKPDLAICLSAIQKQIIEKGFLKAEKKFCSEWKHPSTWLNQQCWEDEVQTSNKKTLYGREAEEWDG